MATALGMRCKGLGRPRKTCMAIWEELERGLEVKSIENFGIITSGFSLKVFTDTVVQAPDPLVIAPELTS